MLHIPYKRPQPAASWANPRVVSGSIQNTPEPGIVRIGDAGDGIGDDAPTTANSLLDSPWLPKIGAAAAAIHGVRRNNGSLFWGALWGLAGHFFPIGINAIAIAQGYGQKRGCP